MEQGPRGNLTCLVGPTAGGKSALAMELAQRLPVEIVSCDSQAVYRGMDLGTAKPTPAERAQVPHHLLDVAEPSEVFSAARFADLADEAIEGIRERGRIPLVVGGTGLWLRALLTGIFPAPPRDPQLRAGLEERIRREGTAALHAELAVADPQAASRIRPGDPVRIVRALEVFQLTGVPISEHHRLHGGGSPRYQALVFGVRPPPEVLEARIAARARAMFDAGLVEETRRLATDPRNVPRLMSTMGYRQALGVIEGSLTLPAAVEETRLFQRRYARRQLTWFRAMPDLRWLSWEPSAEELASQVR